MSRPRIVVVGAGHLGGLHLAKLAAHPGAALVGVVEPDAERRLRAAARHGIEGAAELDAFAGRADAAIVATPTLTHREVGLRALALGWHLLVEKPIAGTAAAAAALVHAAERAGRILQVGHVERFNPAVCAALRAARRPLYIVSERLGPFTGRSADTDVVLDLMVHDLDIVATLLGESPCEVRAVGVPILTHAVDMCSARLAFPSGAVAQLSAGRASLARVRKLRLFCAEQYLSVDCVAGTVKSVRRQPAVDGEGFAQVEASMLDVAPADALAAQLDDFVVSVARGRAPRVTGAAALRALRWVEQVKAACATPPPAARVADGAA